MKVEKNSKVVLKKVSFNKVYLTGSELKYISEAINNSHLSGNGKFTKLSERFLSDLFSSETLLTSSCTHSLEMCAKLLDLGPEDEVIVPSFTFVSTANAFAQTGARPVFADIKLNDFNISIESAEKLITNKTKAICIVHYGGAGAAPDQFRALCDAYNLTLIEDNAHGLGGKYKNQLLGTFGQLSTLSFHETKNVICGEGGATVINDLQYLDRARIFRDKGTNRYNFFNGIVDKYTWVDDGSSWAMSDILAAFLYGQLEMFNEIFIKRNEIWKRYKEGIYQWAESNGVAIPEYSANVEHTGHLFFLRFPSKSTRDNFIHYMKEKGIQTPFHYQALHQSQYAKRFSPSDCPNSSLASDTLVRLPLYNSLEFNETEYIINQINKFSEFK